MSNDQTKGDRLRGEEERESPRGTASKQAKSEGERGDLAFLQQQSMAIEKFWHPLG